jgi:hypothetical protein
VGEVTVCGVKRERCGERLGIRGGWGSTAGEGQRGRRVDEGLGARKIVIEGGREGRRDSESDGRRQGVSE